jgi:hypothetical protein
MKNKCYLIILNATHLVESGWSTMELMQQGGWSSQQMAKRYSNISSTYLANILKNGKR